MKKILLIILIGNFIWAQSVSKVGTSSAKFLNVPVDAWGTGRGQAVVTGYGDASTLFWNPSTIAYLENTTAHFSYTKWFEDINFNYLAVVLPYGNLGSFGINTTFYQTDPIEVTTEMYQGGTGEYYTVSSYAIGMAYARKLTDKFAIGFNTKYIIESIYHSSATGLALDIGGRYTTPWKGIHLGFAITNFGTKMRMTGEDLIVTVDPDPMNSGNNDVINAYYDTDKFDMPLSMTIGVAWDILYSELSKVTLEIDGIYPSDNYSSLNAGLDISMFNDLVYLRTGVANLFLDTMEPHYSFGGGLKYPILGNMTLCVNYAYQTHEYFNKNEHISISITF
ncbi:PorV/PorQ family protein [bacterium]|nr:PorV/PorQ family protein [bacterium]